MTVDPAPLDTPRLSLRRMTADDAPFIVRLLNDPSFIEHIGDKGVRDVDDARNYLLTGPIASFAQHGFGLMHVGLRDSGEGIGMCGLLKRDELDHPDIGIALLPEYRGDGYALEAARAVMSHARAIGLSRILAVTGPGNTASIGLLTRAGFEFVEVIDHFGEFAESNLYRLDLE